MARRRGVECVLCTERFSMRQVRNGEYCLDTMVCFYCYAKMQKQSRAQSCFGKPTCIQMPERRRYLGYDEHAEECRSLCPDRVPCRRVVRSLS